jgi:hypothetical protein
MSFEVARSRQHDQRTGCCPLFNCPSVLGFVKSVPGVITVIASFTASAATLEAMPRMSLDSETTLPNCNLQQTLASLYGELCAVFRGKGLPGTTHFYNVELPNIVFDIAVGAGWMSVVPDPRAPQSTTPRFHGETLVQFGEFDVERWYVDAFMELLRDEIEYHSLDEETTKARLDGLPQFTGIEERKQLIDSYLESHSVNGKPPKIVEIANRAGVDYADFKKWRRGPSVLPDSSSKAKRISILLRHDDRSFETAPKKR